jgi:hypothetical protein
MSTTFEFKTKSEAIEAAGAYGIAPRKSWTIAQYAKAIDAALAAADAEVEAATEPVTDEQPETEPETDEAKMAAVAAEMQAQVEAENGREPIRVAAGLLAIIGDMEEFEESEQALVTRLQAAEVRKDGSVRIEMNPDERDILRGLAEVIYDDGETEGKDRSAARALLKWLDRKDPAVARVVSGVTGR